MKISLLVLALLSFSVDGYAKEIICHSDKNIFNGNDSLLVIRTDNYLYPTEKPYGNIIDARLFGRGNGCFGLCGFSKNRKFSLLHETEGGYVLEGLFESKGAKLNGGIGYGSRQLVPDPSVVQFSRVYYSFDQNMAVLRSGYYDVNLMGLWVKRETEEKVEVVNFPRCLVVSEPIAMSSVNTAMQFYFECRKTDDPIYCVAQRSLNLSVQTVEDIFNLTKALLEMTDENL